MRRQQVETEELGSRRGVSDDEHAGEDATEPPQRQGRLEDGTLLGLHASAICASCLTDLAPSATFAQDPLDLLAWDADRAPDAHRLHTPLLDPVIDCLPRDLEHGG